MEYTLNHISKTTQRGYHYWAVPYVKLMRKSKLAEAVMRPVAIHRANELAYQMGIREKGDLLGKFFRLTIEPVCYLIGLVVEQKDWSTLYA